MNYKTKPNFTEKQVDWILNIFQTEMTLAKMEYTPEQSKALRKYIVSKKNVYENALLQGVLEGKYVCTIERGNVAFAVAESKTPTDTEKALYKERRDALEHSVKLVSFYKNSPGVNVFERFGCCCGDSCKCESTSSNSSECGKCGCGH